MRSFAFIAFAFAFAFALSFGSIGSQLPPEIEDEVLMSELDPGSYKAATPGPKKEDADDDAGASADRPTDPEEIAYYAVGGTGGLAFLAYLVRIWLAYRQIVAAGEGFGQCWLDFLLACFRASCLRRFGGPQPPGVPAVGV